MPSTSFILLLTVCFIILEKATSSTTPYWMNDEYKFTCTSECSKYLKGETYDCMAASPQGLAAGRLILRLLPNLDWRYYRIYEDRNTKDFCKSVMVADEFYENGNKTSCRPITHQDNGLYYDDIRTRSVIAKRKIDDPLLEKLVKFIEGITQSADKNPQEDMVFDKMTDSQDNVHVLPPQEVDGHQPLNGLFQNEQYIGPQYPPKSYAEYLPKSYHQKPKVYQSGVKKPSRTYNDDRTDALCLWVSKDVCQKRKMMVCVDNVCCWTTLDPNLCDVNVSLDDDINRHRESLFHIIQVTEPF